MGGVKSKKLTGVQKKNLLCHDLEKTVFITFIKNKNICLYSALTLDDSTLCNITMKSYISYL